MTVAFQLQPKGYRQKRSNARDTMLAVAFSDPER